MGTYQSNEIIIDNYKVHYLEAGSGKETVVLLHGFALSSEVWLQNIEKISLSYRVIALDILGFGKSDVPTEKADIEFLPEFVVRCLHALKIETCYLVGHSMGGLISTWIAQKYPELVKKLVLVGSAGFKRNVSFHFRLFSMPLFGELMIKPNIKGLGSALKKGAYRKEVVTKSFVENLYQATLTPNRGKFFLRTCRNALTFYGFKFGVLKKIQDKLTELKAPILIIWGRQDAIIPLSHGLKALKYLPQAKMEIFEECGHMPQLEHPEKFNEVVLRFFQT